MHKKIKRCQPLCGTFFEIEISSSYHDECALLELTREAFGLASSIEKIFSPFNESSELSRFNSQQSKNKLNPSTIDNFSTSDLFKEALVRVELLSKESQGLFNSYKNGELNLNGFVKGWIVDIILESLLDKGCDMILVNGGGDMRFWVNPRSKEHATSPQVFVRDLEDPNKLSEIILHEPCAVATSAKYPYDYEHPKEHTIQFVDNIVEDVPFFTATVLAPACWQADALTKVVVQNLAVAKEMARKWNAKFYFKSQKEELCYDPSKM